MSTRKKPTALQRVAKAWADEQKHPGAGHRQLGYEAAALPGWRLVPGMALVPNARLTERQVMLGLDPDGRVLSAGHVVGTKQIQRCYSVGFPVDVLDVPTGYLMLSLLHPFDHVFIMPRPPLDGSAWDGSAWEVRCVPMWEPLAGKLPLGVAALAVAAERGGWGVR